jgi:predicted transglutaminase-like cysteine proteinase
MRFGDIVAETAEWKPSFMGTEEIIVYGRHDLWERVKARSNVDILPYSTICKDVYDVNRNVNSQVEYKPDDARDYWQSPFETVGLKTGDCEDFAILKYFFMQRYFGPSDLRLLLLRSRTGGVGHAVVIRRENVRSAWEIFDSVTDRVGREEDYANVYEPVMSLATSYVWRHRNRRRGGGRYFQTERRHRNGAK